MLRLVRVRVAALFFGVPVAAAAVRQHQHNMHGSSAAESLKVWSVCHTCRGLDGEVRSTVATETSTVNRLSSELLAGATVQRE